MPLCLRNLVGWKLVLAGALLSVGVSAVSSTLVNADDWASRPALSFRGFASLGVARTDSADYGVVSSYSQKKAVFRHWSPAMDSVVGGQARSEFSENDSMVVQVVARAREDWLPHLGLGFWQHRFTPELAVRAGRIASPLFRDTEVVDVGYANLTARPPLPLYAKVNAMSSFDGADVTWQTSVGEATLAMQFYYGDIGYTHRVHPGAPSDLSAKGKGMRGLALSASARDISARVSWTKVRRFSLRSADLDRLNDGIGQLTAGMRALPMLISQAGALAGYENPLDSRPTYLSIGIDWSPPGSRLVAEWTKFQSHAENVGSGEAWHVTLGYPQGRLTPYGFVAAQNNRFRPLDEAAFASTGISAVDAGLSSMRSSLAQLRESADLSMRSVGVGARLELTDTMALKFQYERLRLNYALALGSVGVIANSPPPVRFVSIVLDMTF